MNRRHFIKRQVAGRAILAASGLARKANATQRPLSRDGVSWGAGCAGMKIGEACALGVKLVQVRSLEVRMAMTTEIAVTLVICHNQDDVRSVRSWFR